MDAHFQIQANFTCKMVKKNRRGAIAPPLEIRLCHYHVITVYETVCIRLECNVLSVMYMHVVYINAKYAAAVWGWNVRDHTCYILICTHKIEVYITTVNVNHTSPRLCTWNIIHHSLYEVSSPGFIVKFSGGSLSKSSLH